MATKLGQRLISAQIITEDQLNEAISQQRKNKGRLGTNLIRLGYLTEEQLVTFLSRQYNVPAVNLSDYKIDPSILKLIPLEIARKYLIMPVARVGATLTIVMADPSNVFAIDDVKFMTGYNVEVVVSGESSIGNVIAGSYQSVGGDSLVATQKAQTTQTTQTIKAKDYTLSDDEMQEDAFGGAAEGIEVDVDEFDRVVGEALDDVELVEEQDDDVVKEVERPIVKLVNGVLINAIKERASDIHIEPYETSLRVRQRVDGVMYTVMNLPIKIKNAVTSRIKIMANLDIAE